MEEMFNNFSRNVQSNYNLQNKHLFKKKTGNAKGYYQLVFDESLNTDLKALHEMYKQNLPFRIYGLHTNLYLTDNGYNGLFVDVDTKNSNIQFNKETEEFIATANLTVSELVNYSKTSGYDFSALTGIPGLIGSGVVGNSSYQGSVIDKKDKKGFSDFTKKIIVYDFETGDFVTMIPDDNFFGIRDSLLKRANKTKTRYFVKEVVLKTNYIGEEEVTRLYNAQMNERRDALKISFAEGNAGSFFSNPHIRKSVGKVMKTLLLENPSINIDINGATFSSNGNKNFRTGPDTTDKDAANCLQHVVNKVKEIYGMDLHKEVIILDSDGEIDLETFIARNI
jgi:UDP-N-acetylenolpyruvoylglucosamine reductase